MRTKKSSQTKSSTQMFRSIPNAESSNLLIETVRSQNDGNSPCLPRVPEYGGAPETGSSLGNHTDAETGRQRILVAGPNL